MIRCPVSLFSRCAHSDTGKTTLLRQLLPLLGRQGLAVGVIKRACHDFGVDRPAEVAHFILQHIAQQRNTPNADTHHPHCSRLH
jgi:molybdopterin-guanine dinucleotide biosynthesis protein